MTGTALVPRIESTNVVIGRRRRSAFLQALIRTGGKVNEAARMAGYADASNLRIFRRKDTLFAKAWDDALVAAGDLLEDEAIRRAVDGVREAIYYKGDVVDFRLRFSDQLLMFLLKGIRPEKFRESMQVDATMRVAVGVALLPMPILDADEWEKQSRALTCQEEARSADIVDADFVETTVRM